VKGGHDQAVVADFLSVDTVFFKRLYVCGMNSASCAGRSSARS